ncbi:hypothetical protein BDZ89DRAFT_1145902 [Hymenopellis radicata]|nr:hypothetical protein BDZ89DRAFT_1145902 [Hymenopellis radicata]
MLEFIAEKLGPKKAEHRWTTVLSERTTILNAVQDEGSVCQVVEDLDLTLRQSHRFETSWKETHQDSYVIIQTWAIAFISSLISFRNRGHSPCITSTIESTTVSESLCVRMPLRDEDIGGQYQRPHLFIGNSTTIVSAGKTFRNRGSCAEHPPEVAKLETARARRQKGLSTGSLTVGFGSPKIGARAVASGSPPGEEGSIRGQDKVADACPVGRMLATNAVLISFLCRASGDLDLGYGQCEMTRPRITHRVGAQDSKAQKSCSRSSSPSFPRRVRCIFDGGTDNEHFQIQENESFRRVVGLVPSHRRAPACAPEHIRGRGSGREAKPNGKRTKDGENRAHGHDSEDEESCLSHVGA